MSDCDAWMGRRLWRTFQRTGLFTCTVYPIVLTNTVFSESHAGYENIRNFQALVHRGMISQQEYDAFYADITELAAKDEFFYSITMFVYVGKLLAQE